MTRTLPEINSSALKISHLKRKRESILSIFRCELLVSERVVILNQFFEEKAGVMFSWTSQKKVYDTNIKYQYIYL